VYTHTHTHTHIYIYMETREHARRDSAAHKHNLPLAMMYTSFRYPFTLSPPNTSSFSFTYSSVCAYRGASVGRNGMRRQAPVCVLNTCRSLGYGVLMSYPPINTKFSFTAHSADQHLADGMRPLRTVTLRQFSVATPWTKSATTSHEGEQSGTWDRRTVSIT
jgi:hypothetical protein